MTNHGDDCYFYYYSTCTKGDSCPFRHCEAAVGNEIVCNLWEEGRCFRPMCKFRHFQITHNRKEIACYWENQPAGCQKPHCAFFHEKPRYIDGLYVPPDKGVKKIEEVPQEEPVPAQPILPTASNPQVRGVKKSESQEPVPSPTHPPVVINPADDDEDEDDQFSEEGEVGVSPRKQPGGPKSDGSLNFGVSTLEEIRLRRALKASMKRAMYSFPVGDASANGGKENIHSSYRLMGDAEDGVPLRRSLAERLGRVVDEEQTAVPCHISSKSVKQRLQLPPELITAEPPATKSVKQRLRLPPELIATEPPVETKSKKPEEIRIKTLEEIKQEKAAKSQNQKESTASEITITKTITTKSSKGVKRAITVKDNSIGNVRTFSEILHAKKKRQEENQNLSKSLSEKSEDKNQGKKETAASQATESVGQIKVKTLEEIRREKAARLQAQEAQEPQPKSPDPQESSAKKPRLLRHKDTSQRQDISQKNDNATQKPEDHLHSSSAPTPQESSGNGIKVKTFEEIMREKRLRQQDTEEQPKPTADMDPPKKQSSPALKRKVPTKISFTPDSSTTFESVLHQAKATPATVTAVSSKDSEAKSHPQKPVSNDTVSPSKTLSPRTRMNVQTSQGAAKDTKVKPKLNVKPSVVKPTVQLKPGQKRKAPQRSAVAAVKPLNSTSKQRTDAQVSSVSFDSAQSSDFLCTVSSSDSACKPSPLPQAPEPPAPDTSTVTQSRSLKSPTPAKSRRSSVAASRHSSSSTAPTSAVDEFEDLISEFTTDDALDDSVDPALGEDDLLQELSEMIDS